MNENLFLKRYAVKYLSKYSSSKKNLEIILKRKISRLKTEKANKFKLYNSINLIIKELEKNNLINDNQYTSSKFSLLINQGKSKFYIKNYLMKKGVEKEIISNFINEYYENNSNLELESAKKFLRKKNIVNIPENKNKNLSKMARAGFSYEISKKALEEI